MDMYNFIEKLETCIDGELSKDKSQINTKELGMVVDMVKDLWCAMKDKSEYKYYNSITEAMEESEYGKDYDEMGPLGYPRRRNLMGRYMSSSRRGNRMGYMPEDMRWDYDTQRYGNYGPWDSMADMEEYSQMGYPTSRRQGSDNTSATRRSNSSMNGMSTRYGYSHDELMDGMKKYSVSNPDEATKRKELLNDYVDDLSDMTKELVQNMSTEEKQLWKAKLNKIINM